MTLYNKYRPNSFEDMVGNEGAIAQLKKITAKKTHPHVYLFTGPAGTGKTTLARIIAGMVGASELDIKEINSANNRGIDTARNILNEMRYNPSADSDAIVYILDECHKFTNDMQNALLKPTEDTPEHVYFFLCTTDPQKIIKPLRSRCTEIKLNSLTAKEMETVLKRVIKAEKLDISEDSIDEIIEKANGGSRDALILLETLSGSDKKDHAKILKSMTISDEDPDVIELCRVLLNEKSGWKDVCAVLKKLKEASKLDDAESVRYMVLGYMNAVITNGKMMPRAVAALEAFAEPTYNTGKAGITLACLSTIA